jgi:hypothetical protein
MLTNRPNARNPFSSQHRSVQGDHSRWHATIIRQPRRFSIFPSPTLIPFCDSLRCFRPQIGLGLGQNIAQYVRRISHPDRVVSPEFARMGRNGEARCVRIVNRGTHAASARALVIHGTSRRPTRRPSMRAGDHGEAIDVTVFGKWVTHLFARERCPAPASARMNDSQYDFSRARRCCL